MLMKHPLTARTLEIVSFYIQDGFSVKRTAQHFDTSTNSVRQRTQNYAHALGLKKLPHSDAIGARETRTCPKCGSRFEVPTHMKKVCCSRHCAQSPTDATIEKIIQGRLAGERFTHLVKRFKMSEVGLRLTIWRYLHRTGRQAEIAAVFGHGRYSTYYLQRMLPNGERPPR